jgi:putative transposase
MILMLVRWYVAYPMSYRDIEGLAAEHNLKIDHSTINRWVIDYAPQLEESFRNWVYLYGAVDKEGQTIDLMLSETRDEPAARAFFNKAINLALALLCMFGGLPLQMTIRQIKYLNNIIEQDHRFVKKITNGMIGFKAFHSAEATLSGIELHHMLRKNQHTQSINMTIFEQFYGLAA